MPTLPDVTAYAESMRKRSKPGPKPKCLAERADSSHPHFLPVIKRPIQTRSRERKLKVLQYWKSALVPDESKGGDHMRGVTIGEVSERYKVRIPGFCKILSTLPVKKPS